MATLASTYPSPSSPSFNRRRKSWLRRCERVCCSTLSYFPLCFVYGLTTWAVWVEVKTSLLPTDATSTSPSSLGLFTAALGFLLYSLANISYTTAVFTDPGSPLNPPSTYKSRRAGAGGGSSTGGNYASLPTHEPFHHTELAFTSLTSKTDGSPRFCKKCAVTKPDRAHHCSTCNRCVLKMDHHCPWLATCVGLRNYKAFLLFLIYVSLFCCVCFPVSGAWVWKEIVDQSIDAEEGLMVVNVIMLSVLSGIIGLVLSGFTAWHIYLAIRGQTTIESLEKTRYLSPLKKSMERQFRRHDGERNYLGEHTSAGQDEEQTMGEQLKEIHANFLPGVTRPEEGVDSTISSSTSTPSPYNNSTQSPAGDALRKNYAQMEATRERERYTTYLDELDSAKLPHAFNLGWRKNLRLLFGEEWWLWPVPVCNTAGDGWKWEVSESWSRRRDEIAEDRRLRDEEEEARMQAAGWGGERGHWESPAQHGSSYNNNHNQGAARHYGDSNETAPWNASTHNPNRTPWAPSWAETASNPDYDNDYLNCPIYPSNHNYDDDEDDDDDDDLVDKARYLTTTAGVASVPRKGRRSPNKADLLLGRPSGVFAPSSNPHSLSPVGSTGSRDSRSRSRVADRIAGRSGRRLSGADNEYDTSSDEEDAKTRLLLGKKKKKTTSTSTTADWNDIPDDMFGGGGGGAKKSVVGGRKEKSAGAGPGARTKDD